MLSLQLSVHHSPAPRDRSPDAFSLSTIHSSLSTMSFFRPEIEAMSGYMPGEQPQQGEFIKLNTNENPYPPSPAVARAIEETISRLRKYPDPMAEPFRRRAAELLGVGPEWILCGNGSDDILTIVTRALVGQGQLLRLPYPSYILYKTLGRVAGRPQRGGPLQRRLVAAGRVCRRARRPAAGVSGQSEQPFGHGRSAREGAGNRRAVAVSAVGRRGLRRFRRRRTACRWWPGARRSWCRGR